MGVSKEKIQDLLEIIEKQSKDCIDELENGTSTEDAKMAFVEGKMETISKVAEWLAIAINEIRKE
jgi:hypothetical protein